MVGTAPKGFKNEEVEGTLQGVVSHLGFSLRSLSEIAWGCQWDEDQWFDTRESFDRMLIATALVEQIPLIDSDAFPLYKPEGLSVIWK